MDDVLNACARSARKAARPTEFNGAADRVGARKMQKVEYRPPQESRSDEPAALLAGSDEIAPQFKKPVDDYFRELSKRTGSTGARPSVAPATPTAPRRARAGGN